MICQPTMDFTKRQPQPRDEGYLEETSILCVSSITLLPFISLPYKDIVDYSKTWTKHPEDFINHL